MKSEKRFSHVINKTPFTREIVKCSFRNNSIDESHKGN